MMLWHTFGQPLGIMAVLASLTGGGVLHRFPDLRVGAARGQLRVGAMVAAPPRRALGVGRATWTRPSSTVRRRSTSGRTASSASRPTSCPARFYVEQFGDDNLVFSTDYPHGDSKYPDAVSGFIDLPGLSDESKRKILWDNWARLYGI